ncbi:MAG: hypothetical protein PUF72_05115 [Clostridiales bacterium]|nr:hypothetical protein [Clostridiales bacterium]
MLLIYSIILLAILLFALFKGKNLLVWSLGAYQISSYTIVIALLIYNIIINYNYSLQSGLLEKAGYYIVLHLKIHIADIVVLYNLGNALLLASVTIFLIISGKKAVLQKLLLFIPPILYYIKTTRVLNIKFGITA